MSSPIFPSFASSALWLGVPGLTWNVSKSILQDTSEQITKTGRRAAVINRARPLWRYRFEFNVLRDQLALARNAAKSAPYAEFQSVMSFALGRYGRGLPFFITDPTDCKVTAQTIKAATTAGMTDVEMVRSVGNGGFVEPVGGINVIDPIVVRIDGTPTTAYTANLPYDGWVRFTGAAATTLATGSHAITADFFYYQKVVFEKDTLDFHTSLLDRWDARQVDMRTTWP